MSKTKDNILFLILGNQLFPTDKLTSLLEKIVGSNDNLIFFMREDHELCTHFKYHKHKIIFFLSAMRQYALGLKKLKHTVHYEKLDDTLSSKETFDVAFEKFIKNNKIKTIHFFEIEDKFFEDRIKNICDRLKLQTHIHRSPMFITSRDRFKSYLAKTTKPFMKTFYEEQRKHFKILIDKNNKPVGGKWSFDEENRKPLPKNYAEIEWPRFKHSPTDKEVMDLVEKVFTHHPGNSHEFWLPTNQSQAREWLKHFIDTKLHDFGPYEDALSPNHDFINHSVLTPFLNCGLITPDVVIQEVLVAMKKNKIPLNSAEGFIRQVIGWREFIRGIYQNYSEEQDNRNFFNHNRKLKKCWYDGTTGIAPLDDVIKKTQRLGYAHHIERLMVVGSLMLLLEVHPHEAHRWFMEMFIDSSDWVMGPNVFGMALFSDGGIFATKPYFCGSNYYKKMGPYKSGTWQDAVDGLYWSFVEKNKSYFSKQHRLSMMVKTVEKMDIDRKKKIFLAAETLKNKITTL